LNQEEQSGIEPLADTAGNQVQPYRLLLFGAVILALALIGIWSRPSGAFAALWPANAVMLVWLARSGSSASLAHYFCAALAFSAADLMTGASVGNALILACGNLLSVGTGLLFLHLCRLKTIDLSERASVFQVLLLALIGANAGGLLGMVAWPKMFGGTFHEGYFYWAGTDFVNYIAFLPLLFAMPASRIELIRSLRRDLSQTKVLPAITTLLMCGLPVWTDNPNALAFPLLGLLWCAFTYSVFVTALLTLLYCLFALLQISRVFDQGAADFSGWADLMLIRVSISSIALAPIVVSAYIHSTRVQVAKLAYSANHDSLTGALSRAAFMEALQDRMQSLSDGQCVTLFLMDLDHFKNINDTHGHLAGDSAIVHFVQVVQQCLRAGDVIGRIGGEEFAVVFAEENKEDFDAPLIADRIHKTLNDLPLVLPDGKSLPFTVSIGIAECSTPGDSLEALVQQADDALYKAKAAGRDQTVLNRV